MSIVSIAPIAGDEFITKRVGSSNRQSAIPLHVPGQSESRSKIPPLVVNALQAGIAGVARVNHSCRRILVDGALDALVKPVDVERIDLAVDDRLRKVRFPPDSIVQC